MTVSMYSPIMEGADDFYTVFVDGKLNVTVRRERAISRFELYRSGEIAYDSFDIITLMGEYSMSVSGDDYQKIDARYVDELFQVIEKYDLYEWDGFDKTREGVLDGEGFRLEVTFTDGTSITANGDNAFPADYFDAIGEIQDILDNLRFSS